MSLSVRSFRRRLPPWPRPRGLERALATALLALTGCASDQPAAGAPAVYSSSRYGYSIEYPDSLDLREYTPEYVAIGRADGEAFTAAAEVVVEDGQGESFEAFATERARQACAADGPDRSLQCTEVQALQPVVASAGMEGSVFYLRHIATHPGTEEVVGTSGRGPFFVFELPQGAPGTPHRALFVRAPVVLPPDEADAELIRGIARSLRPRSEPVER